MLVQLGTSYIGSIVRFRSAHGAWRPVTLFICGLLTLSLVGCGEFAAQGLLFLNSPELISIRSKSLQTQLGAGETLEVEATFSNEVEVEGTPGINLTVGDTLVWANYVSGSGSDTLTFNYTVGSNINASEITLSTESPFRETDSSFFKTTSGTKNPQSYPLHS